MQGGITLEVRPDASGVRIALSGELDKDAVRVAEPRLLAAINDPADNAVHLSLARVSLIDSAGLAMLVRLARYALRHCRGFSVVALSDPVRDQFERTRLLSLLTDGDGRSDGHGLPGTTVPVPSARRAP
jgi:anti-anti-sigma factor